MTFNYAIGMTAVPCISKTGRFSPVSFRHGSLSPIFEWGRFGIDRRVIASTLVCVCVWGGGGGGLKSASAIISRKCLAVQVRTSRPRLVPDV